MKRTIVEWILTAITLSVASAMIPSLTIGSSRTLMLSALVLTLLDSGTGPLFKANQLPNSHWFVWIVTYVINALVIFLLLLLVKDSSGTFAGALLASLLITALDRLLDLIMKNGWNN